MRERERESKRARRASCCFTAARLSAGLGATKPLWLLPPWFNDSLRARVALPSRRRHGVSGAQIGALSVLFIILILNPAPIQLCIGKHGLSNPLNLFICLLNRYFTSASVRSLQHIWHARPPPLSPTATVIIPNDRAVVKISKNA